MRQDVVPPRNRTGGRGGGGGGGASVPPPPPPPPPSHIGISWGGKKNTKKGKKKNDDDDDEEYDEMQRLYEVDVNDEENPPSPLASPFVGPLLRDPQARLQQMQHRRNQSDSPPTLNFPPTALKLTSAFSGRHQRSRTMGGLLTDQQLHVTMAPNVGEKTPLMRTPSDPSVTFGSNGHNADRARAKFKATRGDGDDDDDDDDDDDENNSDQDAGSEGQVGGPMSVFPHLEEVATEAWQNFSEIREEAWEEYNDSKHYDWREFWRGGGTIHFCRWILTGFSPDCKHTDEEIQENLNSLARLLSLLREYYDRFGLPEKGGPKDQEYVLREVTKDLYSGGVPMWTLEPAMKKIAEGLTGRRGVDFFMLPRRSFIVAPSSGATTMFRMVRGFDMHKLETMEKVAVRLASFATNTNTAASIPARFPNPLELRRAFRSDSVAGILYAEEELAEEILNIASENEGLFYFTSSRKYKQVLRDNPSLEEQTKTSDFHDFWRVEDNIMDLFSRLACLEAIRSIDKIDVDRRVLYSPQLTSFFTFASSAGACAFWFRGSWPDIFVGGALAVLVSYIGRSPFLSRQERIIFEAVASFVVGLVSALIALTWPEHCCFNAMAISGVLDILQGFRIVYSIIEIMGRHTVTGSADFLEGVFFTALIAYFLKFGQYGAFGILGQPDSNEFMTCGEGISEWWYFFFVPLSAFSWGGLFNANYYDLPAMAAHAVLGFIVSRQFSKAGDQQFFLNNFLAALCVTFSAGVLSRFTGRQALGNTLAGLFVLLPGAYLVSEVYSNEVEGFLTTITIRAIIIGLGAWSGTVLCSPTLLGTNRGLMLQQAAGGNMSSAASFSEMSSGTVGGATWRRDKHVRRQGTGGLLFF